MWEEHEHDGSLWEDAKQSKARKKFRVHQSMKGKFTTKYLIFREIWKIPCVVQIFPVLYLNSLCFPCLEKLITKFPVFPVPWPATLPVFSTILWNQQFCPRSQVFLTGYICLFNCKFNAVANKVSCTQILCTDSIVLCTAFST